MASTTSRMLIVTVLAAVTQLGVPWATARAASAAAATALGALAVGAGLRRHRPAPAFGWRVLGIAMWCFTGGNAAMTARLARPAWDWAPAAEIACNAVGYTAALVAMIGFLSARRARGDREGALDAITVLLASGLLAWQWSASLDSLTADRIYVVVTGAVGLLAVVATAAGLHLSARIGQMPLSVGMLLLAGAVTVVAAVAVAQTPPPEAPRWTDACWVLSAGLIAVAGLHPSMRALVPDDGTARRTPASRLVALGVALLVNPALVIIRSADAPDGTAVATGVAALTGIVLWRSGRLVAGRERDHAALQTSEQRFRHQALHDPLTGLPNRALFVDRVAHALARRERTGADVIVLFIDLDDFKAINDGRGHAAGDGVLLAVAGRLQDCLRASDTASRWGGDEFAILLEDMDVADGVHTAERILDALEGAVTFADHPLAVRASIGVARADSDDPHLLVHRADAAMYRAKHQGKQGYVVAEPEPDPSPPIAA